MSGHIDGDLTIDLDVQAASGALLLAGPAARYGGRGTGHRL